MHRKLVGCPLSPRTQLPISGTQSNQPQKDAMGQESGGHTPEPRAAAEQRAECTATRLLCDTTKPPPFPQHSVPSLLLGRLWLN